MPNPIIKIHNAETGEVIERSMTKAEFDEYKAEQAIEQERIAIIEAKKAARDAVIAKLGLTADEVAALLG